MSQIHHGLKHGGKQYLTVKEVKKLNKNMFLAPIILLILFSSIVVSASAVTYIYGLEPAGKFNGDPIFKAFTDETAQCLEVFDVRVGDLDTAIYFNGYVLILLSVRFIHFVSSNGSSGAFGYAILPW